MLAHLSTLEMQREISSMELFICQFCGSERKNHNSWRNHERCCPSNPDRNYKNGMSGKKGRNQYQKAKDLGLPAPEISEETRKILSEKAIINNLNRLPEVNKKISESMKKAHKEGKAWNIGKSRWNNEPSYPEKFFMIVVENEFDDRDYKNEYPIGIYSADFCWPHLKKVIEIDGDQHQRFDEYIERDKKKDKFLFDEGYQVLRVIWKEMYKNPKEKIKECYDFIHK